MRRPLSSPALVTVLRVTLLLAALLPARPAASQTGFWLPPDFRGNVPFVSVAIGDSITFGTTGRGTTADRPYPRVLQDALQAAYPGFVVVNRGVGGETTSGGLSRLAGVLATDRPLFVLIMEGTNDATFGVDPGVILGNLRAMVRLAKANFVIPLLGAIPPNFRPDERATSILAAVNAALPAVAAEEGVRFVDTFSPLNNGGLYASDLLHPNQAGYAVLGQAWAPALGAAIGEARTVVGGVHVAGRHDFDGDGTADIAVYRPGTGEWFVRSSAGGPPLVVQFGDPMQGDVPVPADYDGDGTTDFAVYRSINSEWRILQSTTGTVASLFWGASVLGDVPVPGDYDGDGLADVAVSRLTTGQWFVRGSQVGLIAVGWGSPALRDTPVAADYDGDGLTDIAVYRATTGQWFVLQSTSGILILSWGSPDFGDRPIPADYDGDGKADIAVFRPTTGQWFALRSSDLALLTLPWGAPLLDLPVPANFAGVPAPGPGARAEIAVFRPTTAEWFVLDLAAGVFTLVPWGSTMTDLPLPQPARLR